MSANAAACGASAARSAPMTVVVAAAMRGARTASRTSNAMRTRPSGSAPLISRRASSPARSFAIPASGSIAGVSLGRAWLGDALLGDALLGDESLGDAVFGDAWGGSVSMGRASLGDPWVDDAWLGDESLADALFGDVLRGGVSVGRA